MAKRITVVVSQGQSASPAKRQLEEDLVTRLLLEAGFEVVVIPHLYDLAPDGTGMLCLQGISGDMVVLSWLYPRAAHWTLARNRIAGRFGVTLLKGPDADDDDDDDNQEETPDASDEKPRVGAREHSNRTIYCLDLRSHAAAEPYIAEIRRIASEAATQTVSLLGWIQGSPQPQQLARYLNPEGMAASAPRAPEAPSATSSAAGSSPTAVTTAAPQLLRVDEEPARRWYPVIDYSRCTNCMECMDFCLFGVYGLDAAETILIEQPDNCRKGCPACSRVCPENAIIFPQHKSPAIAGSPDENAGGLKIDLSRLFGAPDAIDVAAMERDVELVAAGRDAVGLNVGIPKRQAKESAAAPKDDLDALMDQLDSF